MASQEKQGRPSERRIGARIRVKREHAEAAAKGFAEAGLTPIYRDELGDGSVSFWFSKDDASDLLKLCETIPTEFFALQAVVR